MKDYKYLLDRKEEKLVPFSYMLNYAIVAIVGWGMVLYMLDKYC